MTAPYAKARVSGRGAEVNARQEGDQLIITVGLLQAYAALVIEPAERK